MIAFLAIAEGAAVVVDEAAEEWLIAQGLLERNAAGMIEVTAKGSAWGGMLVATPLPVEVSRWGDPRESTLSKAAPVTIDDLATLLRNIIPPVSAQAPGRSTSRPPNTAAPMPTEGGAVEPLPGFRANEWTTLQPGQAPPGLQRDDAVVVQMRSGRVMGEKPKLMASQVIWKWRDEPHPDDVLYYRVGPRDDQSVQLG